MFMLCIVYDFIVFSVLSNCVHVLLLCFDIIVCFVCVFYMYIMFIFFVVVHVCITCSFYV